MRYSLIVLDLYYSANNKNFIKSKRTHIIFQLHGKSIVPSDEGANTREVIEHLAGGLLRVQSSPPDLSHIIAYAIREDHPLFNFNLIRSQILTSNPSHEEKLRKLVIGQLP